MPTCSADTEERRASLLSRLADVLAAEGVADAALLYQVSDESLASLARRLRGQRGASLSSLKRKSSRFGWTKARQEFRVLVAMKAVTRLGHQPVQDQMTPPEAMPRGRRAA